MNAPLRPGLYERIVTRDLAQRLNALGPGLSPVYESMSAHESATRISRYLRDVALMGLSAFEEDEGGAAKQIAIANRLLLMLKAELDASGKTDLLSESDLISPEMLLALLHADPVTGPVRMNRPGLPLAQTHLLINARGEHQVGHEIGLEIESANRIDLLCSFLLWSGYKRLEPSLHKFMSRPGAVLRVLTTVYMGATEPRVLDELCRLGATVRVSYDTKRTRLHAKAWLLHRETGHSTAFVGSSNLSASALTDGLEWNVRVGDDSPYVLEKFTSAFETYWNDNAFETYNPDRDGEKLRRALQAEHGTTDGSRFIFDLTPRPFQEAILEKLENERFTHNRMRNLVVAATGTGKTVIAAFDYQRLSRRFQALHGRRPTLLFVAHRREILTQARDTFRAVLREPSFGELLVDGERPENSDFLFASVQSLARLAPSQVPPSRWDIVVIDEFHHAEASSYGRWLKHLKPWVLLGLTATPERADGQDVTQWVGGHIAVELRLWDAIEQGLLAPFQYFGLTDPLDLGQYWKRGQLDMAALDNILSGHHVRAEAIFKALLEYIPDPTRMRAIGFCVGQGHARFMADFMNAKGIAAATALGSDSDRAATLEALRSGQLKIVFTVDALSEGVDVPQMDTALFLRPTASPTVFLQQLGRGLRLSEGKRCLTVLDFVATPDREFRLDRKYTALLGGTRRDLEHHVEAGFPMLPPGCSIQLTDDAKAVVLQSIRASLSSRKSVVVDALRTLGAGSSIQALLNETRLELSDIYRKRSLTALRREAGWPLPAPGPKERELSLGIARLLTMDDPVLLRSIAQDCMKAVAPEPNLYWKMVLATITPDLALSNPSEAMQNLWSHPTLVMELGELAAHLSEAGAYTPLPFMKGRLALQVHCHYRREQIIAALTGDTRDKLATSREGVLSIAEHNIDALFVTLRKSEERYSPRTRYKDYPLSRTTFHWQSMSSTRQSSARGQRHINHVALGITPLLFVRIDPEDAQGETQPFMFLGEVSCIEADGDKPINITWQLSTPMPAEFFEKTCVIA